MNSETLDCMADYASLMEAAGHAEAAVRLYAAVAAAREALGLPRAAHRESEMQSRIAAARASLGDRAFDAAWSVGLTWSRDDAISHALTSIPKAVEPA